VNSIYYILFTRFIRLLFIRLLLSFCLYPRIYIFIFVIPVPFFFCACEIGCFCPFFLLELSVPLFLFCHSLPSPSIHFRFESFINRISVHLRLGRLRWFWLVRFVRFVCPFWCPFVFFCSALFSISVLHFHSVSIS